VNDPLEADPLARELEALLVKTRGLRMDARVSAFMRPDPPTLPHGATLADAIEVMVSHRIDGVPIVNDQGALVGLMTKTLALREINQRGRGDAPVRAIMKTDPLVARPGDDISTLIAANVGSLPVVDAGRVVGIVTLSDTIRAYFSSLLDVKALKEELAGTIASSFDGIYLTDASGRVLQANEAFTRITGMAREELLGFTMDELVSRGVFKQPLDLSALQQGQTVTISQEVRTGKEILVTSNPIRDEGGRLLRVVHNVRDMTELNSLRDQLEKAEGLSHHYKEQLDRIRGAGRYLAKSKRSRDLVALVMRLSQVDVTVLVLGESGVGKEMIAEMLHENSPRRDKPLIAVNCAAIPETLLESELFGYEAGAFTGADKRGKAGMFELAHGGTIFFDEIGEMPLHLQSKLLRVIQQRIITRLGGSRAQQVDVRIIAASNSNLAEMVERDAFRKDLFYRLNVVPVVIPPLRERREEIPDFVFHFTTLFNRKYRLNRRFDERAIQRFMAYDWPGNVRELQNTVERAVLTSPEDIIRDVDFLGNAGAVETARPESDPAQLDLRAALTATERDLIERALASWGTTRKAAAALGLSQPTLVRKMAACGIQGKKSALRH